MITKCDWKRYSFLQFNKSLAPNNIDMIERGHVIASYTTRNRFGVSDECVESLTLCKRSNLIQKIDELRQNNQTKDLFHCIFENIINGSIRTGIKNNINKTIQTQSKRSHYLFNKVSFPNDNVENQSQKLYNEMIILLST